MSNEHVGSLSRDSIEERARRRWVRFVVALAVVVPVGILILNSTILRPGHPSSSGHRPPTPSIVVSLVLAMVVGFGVGALLVRHGRRTPGSIFAAPLTAGLPRQQRRSAMRNIRRGTPSTDSEQASIERDIASTLVRTSPRSFALFGGLTVLEVVITFVQHTVPARLFFAGSAILFVAFLVTTAVQIRRARTYLARTDGTAHRDES